MADSSEAGYTDIQEWVQSKYGFKVTRTCIANVRRESGMTMRNGDSRSYRHKAQEKTIQKKKAVIAALKHFDLI